MVVRLRLMAYGEGEGVWSPVRVLARGRCVGGCGCGWRVGGVWVGCTGTGYTGSRQWQSTRCAISVSVGAGLVDALRWEWVRLDMERFGEGG
jgi:hypothetical protein